MRGMSATAQLLKKFGYIQQERPLVMDPYRTSKGQRCKYSNSIKVTVKTDKNAANKANSDKQVALRKKVPKLLTRCHTKRSILEHTMRPSFFWYDTDFQKENI